MAKPTEILQSLLVLGLLFEVCSGQYVNTRIVNGTDALPGQYPYAVSLRYNQSHECGGSIIGSKWILTAAHCIYPQYIDLLTVLCGSVYVHTNDETQYGIVVGVSEAFIHENYTECCGYDNDIGLLHLKESITFSRYVQTLNLPPFMEKTPAGSEAVLLGWGYPETGTNVVMDILQAVTIFIFPNNVCTYYHGELFNNKVHICAGIPSGGKGQCTGDSGGPLIVDNTQYGIVSWSDKPCATTPGVLVRVSAYREWIFTITGL